MKMNWAQNNKTRNVCKKISSKTLTNSEYTIIRDVSTELNISRTLLLSIYLIETHYRPLPFRTAEYVMVFINIILKCCFPVIDIKDRSIGRCQIKLSHIYHASKSEMINYNSSQVTCSAILKSIFKYCFILRNHIYLCGVIIKTIELKETRSQFANVYNIALKYNGSDYYGQLLGTIYQTISKD